MRDIVWTIIGIWIVWKIFHAFKTMGTPHKNNAYKEQDSRDTYNRKKEGEITVNHVNDKRKSGIDSKNTEYVDYEEIK